ncbi:MAG: hypothetical protein D3916_14115, partial [Candidatus Electrothrix sp. MAN1_4]|nr:hypothetical protein [Candidatus Electrothrix sp. MAN1_4]
MSCRIANALADLLEVQVFFIFHHQNFTQNLSDKVKTISTNIKTHTPLPFINNIIHWKDIITIKKKFTDISPDYIVNCQGTIELGLTGLFAAKLSGIQCISYIPIVYDFTIMKGSFIH